MTIGRLFKRGINSTLTKSRIAVYLWLFNLLFSLLIVAPFYFLIRNETSNSLMGDQLIQGIDFLLLGDILTKYSDMGALLSGSILIPVLLFIALSIFVNGGIIGRLFDETEKPSLKDFISDSARYFFRFFRVFLISCVIYGLIFGLLFRLVGELLKTWTKNAGSEWPLIWSSNIKFLILLLLFSIVRMFFDYVRVRLVVEDSRKTIRATLLTFRFVFTRFFKAWGLYIMAGLVTLVFGAIYLVGAKIIPNSGILFALLLIWQQFYVISKMWTKILFFSSELHLVKQIEEG